MFRRFKGTVLLFRGSGVGFGCKQLIYENSLDCHSENLKGTDIELLEQNELLVWSRLFVNQWSNYHRLIRFADGKGR